MKMHDKYGKPLAVGDSAIVDSSGPDSVHHASPDSREKTGYEGQGAVLTVIDIRPRNRCGASVDDSGCERCGAQVMATFHMGGGYLHVCGCALTKLDGSGVEEPQHEEAEA